MSENFYVINTQNQYRQTFLEGLLDPGLLDPGHPLWLDRRLNMGRNNISSRKKKIWMSMAHRKSTTEANIDKTLASTLWGKEYWDKASLVLLGSRYVSIVNMDVTDWI